MRTSPASKSFATQTSRRSSKRNEVGKSRGRSIGPLLLLTELINQMGPIPIRCFSSDPAQFLARRGLDSPLGAIVVTTLIPTFTGALEALEQLSNLRIGNRSASFKHGQFLL